jgi:hypothetical protein
MASHSSIRLGLPASRPGLCPVCALGERGRGKEYGVADLGFRRVCRNKIIDMNFSIKKIVHSVSLLALECPVPSQFQPKKDLK